jgi:polysaccharide biosynthesis transport protein
MQQANRAQFQQLANMLVRRRRLILAMGAFGVALAGTVGLLLPARYTAKAQIVIESPQASAVSGHPGVTDPVNELAIETHVTMLTSRGHLKRVRDSLLAGLELRAVLPPDQSDRETKLQAPASEISSRAATEVGPLSLEDLELGTKVFQERRSRVIAVNFTSTRPDQAAAVANQIARLYVQTQAGQPSGLEQQLAAVSHQLSIAKSDLAARQGRLTFLRDLKRREDTEALIEALDSAAVAEFHREQTALLQSQAEVGASLHKTHPKVQAVTVKLNELRQKIGIEVDRAITQLQYDMQVAGERVQSLQQRLESIQIARSEAREAEVTTRDPQREAAASIPISERLLRRQKELGETSAGVRMLSVADVPNRPSSPNPILFVFPALIAFSIAGGFLAIVLEGLDQGLRSGRDINDALGISCIGLVPQLLQQGQLRTHEYLLQNPFAAYTEAIRSIAIAALDLSAPKCSPKVFLITSSVPGEGKTTLAVSFAVYAARLQRRVVLVDLSFRNPAILRELGGGAEREAIDGQPGEPQGTVIRHIPELALDYISLPRASVDPLTILSSRQLPDLLRELRERYDCVVIDSAPLVGTAEARLLGSMVDKVLFAVKWGSTRPEVVQHAFNLLRNPYTQDRDPTAFASAIITQVDLLKHASYQYGDVVGVGFDEGRNRRSRVDRLLIKLLALLRRKLHLVRDRAQGLPLPRWVARKPSRDVKHERDSRPVSFPHVLGGRLLNGSGPSRPARIRSSGTGAGSSLG